MILISSFGSAISFPSNEKAKNLGSGMGCYFFAESMSFCRSIVIAVGSRAAAYTFTIRPAAPKPRADKAAIRIVGKNFFGFG